jgi:hypothetical protein
VYFVEISWKSKPTKPAACRSASFMSRALHFYYRLSGGKSWVSLLVSLYILYVLNLYQPRLKECNLIGRGGSITKMCCGIQGLHPSEPLNKYPCTASETLKFFHSLLFPLSNTGPTIPASRHDFSLLRYSLLWFKHQSKHSEFISSTRRAR